MILSNEESEDMFYNALCNAVGTGYMQGYGLELETNDNHYGVVKKSLLDKGQEHPCYEDMVMERLRMGLPLTIVDEEGEGEMTRTITIKDVHERISKMPEKHLADMIGGTDDVVTADVLLQTVFFEDIIFG